MRRNNTMGIIWYLAANVICYIYFAWMYTTICFHRLPIPFQSEVVDYASSRTILMLLMGVCVLAGVLLGVKRQRNYVSVLINSILPLELYTFVLQLSYLPGLALSTAAVTVITLIVYGWLLFSRPVSEEAERKLEMRRRLLQYLHGSGRIAAGVMSVLLIVLICAPFFGIRYKSSEIAPELTETQEFGTLVEANLDTLMGLEAENWQQLDTDGKMNILKLVADIEASVLGFPETPYIVDTEIEDSAIGKFITTKNQIEIDREILEDCSPEACLDVLLHESYHSYQQYLCDALESTDSRYRRLALFRDARIYSLGFEEYVDSSENNEEYQNNPVELDANEYAYKQTHAYYSLISFLLEEVYPEKRAEVR